MAVSIAEYLGQRTDVDQQIVPVAKVRKYNALLWIEPVTKQVRSKILHLLYAVSANQMELFG